MIKGSCSKSKIEKRIVVSLSTKYTIIHISCLNLQSFSKFLNLNVAFFSFYVMLFYVMLFCVMLFCVMLFLLLKKSKSKSKRKAKLKT